MSEGIKIYPDLKFLKESKLVSDNLISTVTNDRQLFNQSFIKDEVKKEECLKQIKMELSLMEICRLEINKEPNPSVFELEESDNILNGMNIIIDHLYFTMLQTFPIELEPLVDYMTFIEKNKKYTTNKIDVLMSKKKSPPELYLAAGIELYKRKYIEGARFFFSEGIKNHKNFKDLYLEELWVEVHYLEVTNGKSYETALKIYQNTIEHFIGDMEFHFMLLEKSLQLKSIRNLQYYIILDLVDKYKRNSKMWLKIANLCYDGFIYIHNSRWFNYTENVLFRIQCCTHSYQEGLRNVSVYKDRHHLLIMFTDFIVAVWKSNRLRTDDTYDFVKLSMERAFKMGHVPFRGIHKPEYYVYWATYSRKIRSEVLKLAIDKNRNNVDVWAEMLRFHMNFFNKRKGIKKIFKAGNLALKNNALPLWQIMEPYWNNNDVKRLEKLYIKGANSLYEEISTVYGIKYLRWYTNHYENVAVPEHSVNINFIRNLHNVVCMESGIDNICLWIDYIRFEFTNNSSANARNVYNTAMKIQVKQFLKNILRQEYDLMKADYQRRIHYYNVYQKIEE